MSKLLLHPELLKREYENLINHLKRSGTSYEQAMAVGLMWRQVLGSLTPDMRIALAMAVDHFQEAPEFALEPDPPVLDTYKELAGFEVVQMNTTPPTDPKDVN